MDSVQAAVRNVRSKCRCSCVLQFTFRRAVSCVLHRPPSQVIHCTVLSFSLRRGEFASQEASSNKTGKTWQSSPVTSSDEKREASAGNGGQQQTSKGRSDQVARTRSPPERSETPRRGEGLCAVRISSKRSAEHRTSPRGRRTASRERLDGVRDRDGVADHDRRAAIPGSKTREFVSLFGQTHARIAVASSSNQ